MVYGAMGIPGTELCIKVFENEYYCSSILTGTVSKASEQQNPQAKKSSDVCDHPSLNHFSLRSRLSFSLLPPAHNRSCSTGMPFNHQYQDLTVERNGAITNVLSSPSDGESSVWPSRSAS